MATLKRKTVRVDICHRMETFHCQSVSSSNSFLQMHLLDNLHLRHYFEKLRAEPRGLLWTRTARHPMVVKKLTQIVLSKCKQLYFWKYFLQVNWNRFSFNIILLPMLQSNYKRVLDVSLNIYNPELHIIKCLSRPWYDSPYRYSLWWLNHRYLVSFELKMTR